MTETERKALDMVNYVMVSSWLPHEIDRIPYFPALCRAIEQHEAFRQEVSDACKKWTKENVNCREPHDLDRFIIAKPDPLVEALEATGDDEAEERAWRLRAALAARGLEVRKIGEGE